MAKKCSKCGFLNNPDDAHYCGKCGANIASYSHVWKMYDSTDYSTYNKYDNRVISNTKFREYEDLEKTVKESNQFRLRSWWRNSKHDIMELFLSFFFFIALLLIIFWLEGTAN